MWIRLGEPPEEQIQPSAAAENVETRQAQSDQFELSNSESTLGLIISGGCSPRPVTGPWNRDLRPA